MLVRMATRYLGDWKHRPSRKPLVLRGARQVGKTHLVTHWGNASFGSVVTIDLERERELRSVFDQSDPWTLLQELAVLKNQRLVPGLHVIAAGSLLDFALRDFARDWNYDLQIDA